MTPNFDLYFHTRGMDPRTEAGKDFLHSTLLNGPLYAPRDYQNAVDNGLHVSFENRDVLNQTIGTRDTEWEPVTRSEYDNPGYSDDVYPPLADLPSNAVPDCDYDDNPDAGICPESERFGE